MRLRRRPATSGLPQSADSADQAHLEESAATRRGIEAFIEPATQARRPRSCWSRAREDEG
jgi:hypothetical protein